MTEIRHEERYGPYMTANNAPAPFVASASQNTWGAFRAFSESLDDDISFTGLAAGTEQWVQIQLDASIRIWAFRIACRTTVSAKDAGQVPKNFTVLGSVDGNTFEDIQVYVGVNWEQFTSWDATTNKYNWSDPKPIEINCTKEYQYYRFLFGECQSVSTQKNGPMVPTAANTVKPTLIDLYQVEGESGVVDPPPSPDGIDAYLNTTEGMEIILNNTKKDDDTIQLAGVDWFRFNNVVASTIYASGNHWIGLGTSSEQLKVCRRDGAMYSLYRQEGLLYGYYEFLKIRWEGYTQYNSTDISRRLVYELFLFDTGDMFLNVIQTPTNSSYIGTSQMVCGSNTYNLDIPINSTPMITFAHQDDTGSSWAVSYEKISILPPFDRKYLVRDAVGQYYTITEGALAQVQIDTLNTQAFRDHGIDHTIFLPTLLKTLANPIVLYWQDSDTELPQKQLNVQATPFPQVIYSGKCDMTHESIKGITNAACNCSDDVIFQVGFDNRQTWMVYNTDAAVWETAAGGEAGMTKGIVENIPQAAWTEQATTGKYEWKILLPNVDSYIDYLKMNYVN